MLVSDKIMDLNSDLSLMNIGESCVVSDNAVVKEQHSKYRRRSFLKLEPTIFEDFATICISDNGETGNVTSKRRRRTVSKKRPLPTETDSLKYQDCSIMNDTCVDFSEIKTLNDEVADPELTICKNVPLNHSNFSNESVMENLIDDDDVDNKSTDATCLDFSILDNNETDGITNEQVKSKRRRTGPELISTTVKEDIMEDNDEDLSVMNVTCGDFSVLIKLGEDDSATKENLDEKPKPRRSLRRKIKPLNASTQVLGSSQVSTSNDSYSDIEQYYLCKKYKRLPNSLETIFEEPMQKNNKNLYISARKFNRTIKFGGNSASANLSKIKKRITKASKLVSSKKFLKRRKVSMKNLLKALSTIDELE